MSSLTREHLIDAVAAGFTETQIAESIGVTPSAVAQAIEKYDIKNLAETKKKASKFSNIDDNLNRAEEILSKKLLVSIEMMTKPLEIARVLQTINAAKRRSLDEGRSDAPQTNIAILNLPARATVEIVKNTSNEVVEIGGRPMLTINPTLLMQRVKEVQKLPALEMPNDSIGKEEIRKLL